MSIRCMVVSGQKLGRKIGFPTANLAPVNQFVHLQKGVYAVRLWYMTKEYYGVMNIGTRPTIISGELAVEVHILDFNNDIYGEEVEIEIITYIRNEKKFESLETLQLQIFEDTCFTRRLVNYYTV